jgi:hypothetical protein
MLSITVRHGLELSLPTKLTGLNDRLQTLFERIQNIQLLREAEGGTLPPSSGFLGKNVGNIRVFWMSILHMIQLDMFGGIDATRRVGKGAHQGVYARLRGLCRRALAKSLGRLNRSA